MAGLAHGQVMPTGEAFEQAVDALRPAAAVAGLELRTDGLGLALWQARSPLLAWRAGARCHIGYQASHPRYDARWLFPALPDGARAAWLQGLVGHELMHCMAQHGAVTAMLAGVGAGPTAHRAELLADLAFAWHVDANPHGGLELVAHLASLREAHKAQDPLHDSAPVLRCYQRQRERGVARGDFDLATLQAWLDRCTGAESAE